MTPTILVEYTDALMQPERGVLVNSHWSDAFGCWILLISSENGMLHSVRSDTLGLSSEWVEDAPNIVFMDEDNDDEGGYTE